MTRTQILAAIAANNSRRYFEIERPSILLRYRDITKEGASELLRSLENPSAKSSDVVSRAIDAVIEKAKPGHLVFFERELQSLNRREEEYVKAIPAMQARSASGLIKALKRGLLPTEISSPLFKWLPFLRETSRQTKS